MAAVQEQQQLQLLVVKTLEDHRLQRAATASRGCHAGAVHIACMMQRSLVVKGAKDNLLAKWRSVEGPVGST